MSDGPTAEDLRDRRFKCADCGALVEVAVVSGTFSPIGLSLMCECSEASLNVDGLTLRESWPSSWGDTDG